MSDAPLRYRQGARGSRLHPHILHSRYHVLTQLTRALRQVVASLPGGGTVLDFGCGESPYRELFAEKFDRYRPADLQGNPRAEVIVGDNGELPLPDGSCDVVLSSQVLEHVASPKAYLREARRVVRPGGALILSTHGAWQYHPDPVDYWRWTRAGLELELANAAFQPVEVHSVLGRTGAALQLLQDALTAALPRPLRPLRHVVSATFQGLIGASEYTRRDPSPHDASVYVVLARPVEAPS